MNNEIMSTKHFLKKISDCLNDKTTWKMNDVIVILQ